MSLAAVRKACPHLTDAQLRALFADAAAQFPAEPLSLFDVSPAVPKKGKKTAKPVATTSSPAVGRTRVQCDGASRGNPGPAAAGVVITPPSGKAVVLGKVLGNMTNNQAEYRAILLGLRECLQLGFTDLDIMLDSELAVRQLNGQYKVKNADLLPLYHEAKRLLARFAHATVRHVPREQNACADAAANAALDGKI